ncbi:MAG: S9 family peptidase [Acidobacteriota bacterium]|nr:S9 family peptidase [Acidobacteriota bacterium]
MSHRPRRTAVALAAFLVLSFLTAAAAIGDETPVRGKALYDKLRAEARDLVKSEGVSRVNWVPGSPAYFLAENKSFVRVDAETGEKTPLFDEQKIAETFTKLTGRETQALPFQRFVYLPGGRTIQFDALNKAFVYEIETGLMWSYEPERPITGVRGRRYTEEFSPDLQYRAYTRDFDLYVKNRDGKEIRLTHDGNDNLRNGFPDWVYPEELSQYDAFWWSPDSKKIAYMQFDQSPVGRYPLVYDVTPMPRLELLAYPKAGTNNPIIRFFIVDVATGKTVQVDTGLETNVYLYRGQWWPDGREFVYRRLNRMQNEVEIFAADPETGKSRLIFKDEDSCYIDENLPLILLEDNKHAIWASERTGFKELFLYDRSGKLIRQLTNARLPVGSILGVDEASGWIYFSGSQNRGLESHGFKVRLDGKGFERITRDAGMHGLSFSPDFRYYVNTFSSFDEPGRTLLFSADGKQIREIGRSTATAELEALKLVKPEPFTFKSADGKHDLDGILYKPAHFDPAASYPLILSVYGGPGAKRIYNRYNLADGNQALAQLGFIVASVDHRGVSGRGKTFQNLMYLNLGEIEVADHAAAVKHLGTLPYVDAGRVGIFGHSYGGYLTCMALLKEPDVFHVGVAGAPVTCWRNYDTIYTERYMRRPQDNPDGYEKGSAMTYAKNLKGRLFLHHGAVDDNVHPGNSVQLLHALLDAGKRVDFMLYPEQQHGIRYSQYADSRVEYFIEHLKPEIR